ncbi:MAG: ABC transporter ATP-binding protein, partial [Acidimicrobiales bacterium]
TILGESLRSDRRLTRAQKRAESIRRLAEVGILDESVIDRYPFQLSGGMRQRVAIAAALARDPRLLVADEPSTALDVTTQRDILDLVKRIQEARQMGLILITHDLRVAFSMCDRIYVLYAGSLLETAPAAELAAEPLHPYSHGLLLSEPPVDQRVRDLITIPGSVPDPDDVASCCVFAPRCRWASHECYEGRPPLVEVASSRLSACLRLGEIRDEMASLRRQAVARSEPPSTRRREKPLIRVADVHKVFHTAGRAVTALDGVSIEVDENQSVGLVGESGSGKTTLARILVGLERATSGGITIAGVDVGDWAKLNRRDRRLIRSMVQVVFQDPYSSLNPMRTIGGTLAEAVTTHHPRATKVMKQVDGLLQSVGLPTAYAERKPVALSGGERQRVAIARALAVNPRLLICDEPVSALDVSVQAQILNLFIELRSQRGIGYLFITHDLSIVRQVTEQLYVMHRGRVVEHGPTEQVLTSPQHAYTINLLDSIPRPNVDWPTSGRLGLREV